MTARAASRAAVAVLAPVGLELPDVVVDAAGDRLLRVATSDESPTDADGATLGLTDGLLTVQGAHPATMVDAADLRMDSASVSAMTMAASWTAAALPRLPGA